MTNINFKDMNISASISESYIDKIAMTHSDPDSFVTKIMDAIKDFFCGTDRALVKTLLLNLAKYDPEEKERMAFLHSDPAEVSEKVKEYLPISSSEAIKTFIQLKNLAGEGYKHDFKIIQERESPYIIYCMIQRHDRTSELEEPLMTIEIPLIKVKDDEEVTEYIDFSPMKSLYDIPLEEFFYHTPLSGGYPMKSMTQFISRPAVSFAGEIIPSAPPLRPEQIEGVSKDGVAVAIDFDPSDDR